jgi:hypothetical protein
VNFDRPIAAALFVGGAIIILGGLALAWIGGDL